MSMKISKFDIKYETELLESLEWNEEKLKQLLDYINSVVNDETLISPNDIIVNVKNNYSDQTGEILKKIFLEISIMSNLHITKEGNYEN